eukprot:TRINITY_DN18675_c0_g1_i1.p1 TRINITY_DN18675_c0_g1~~TRINITY_DN18675_c0_g1_i1.p1  ORF type:complete len:164 (+),score=8.50 TRINITY_DN18675_c0_g1_i1:151-642(+)
MSGRSHSKSSRSSESYEAPSCCNGTNGYRGRQIVLAIAEASCYIGPAIDAEFRSVKKRCALRRQVRSSTEILLEKRYMEFQGTMSKMLIASVQSSLAVAKHRSVNIASCFQAQDEEDDGLREYLLDCHDATDVIYLMYQSLRSKCSISLNFLEWLIGIRLSFY